MCALAFVVLPPSATSALTRTSPLAYRVACALVYRILFDRHAAFEMAASYIEPPEDHNLHWDGREAEPLLQGEYTIVLQLVGVLKNGKLAKRLADKATECACTLTLGLFAGARG